MKLAYQDHIDDDSGQIVSFQQTGVRGQWVEVSVDDRLVAKVLLSDLGDFLMSATAFSLQMPRN